MNVPAVPSFAPVVRSLLESGVAAVVPKPAQQALISGIFREGHRFYDLSSAEKLQCRPAEGHNTGFREVGEEYSITPEVPDIKESVTIVPSEEPDIARQPACVQRLYEAMRRFLPEVDELCRGVMAELGALFGSDDILYAADDSQLAVNFYPEQRAGCDVLIPPHEDGCLLTVLTSTAPGLEILGRDGRFRRRDDAVGSLLILPGEGLALATDAQIAPAIHRVVRAPGVTRRLTIAYDATADIRRTVLPWVSPDPEDRSRRLDLAARATLIRFGLPPLGGQ